jgi:hypothetical protein
VKKALFVFLVFLGGCATQKIKPLETDLSLFPNGTYEQTVEVVVSAKGHERNFDFNGVVQKSPEQFMLVGYNGFGFSLFKIREFLSAENEINLGKVTFETSIKQIEEHKDFFLKVFSMVKTILDLEKNDRRIQNNIFETYFEKVKSQVQFQEFDQQGVPLKIKIETPNLYQISIQTTKYQFKK